ncbi:MAG: hypothetical protein V2A77_01005 [Pseudomonadota bacterium]
MKKIFWAVLFLLLSASGMAFGGEATCTGPSYLKNGASAYSWALTQANASGARVSIPDYQDRTIQVAGAFDSATIVIQGSNDGSNWVTLNDTTGTALSRSAAFLAGILENPRYIRPYFASPGASTSVTVTLVGVNSARLR